MYFIYWLSIYNILLSAHLGITEDSLISMILVLVHYFFGLASIWVIREIREFD